MQPVRTSAKLNDLHSDIRGDIYMEALRLQSQGEAVLKLNTGNPGNFGFSMPSAISEALAAGLDRAVPYCDFRGMADAREAIRAYHAARGVGGFGEEDIFIGNGVSELASLLATALLSGGDEVLLPTPCYPLWSNSVRIAGARPVFYPCDERSSWLPDLWEMERRVTPKTKAVLLINPNNPTGAVYGPETVAGILEIARRHDLLVISDEIYDHLLYDGAEMVSTAALAPRDMVVVTLNGLSKSHFVCGFRCGWMVISGPAAYKRDLINGLSTLASMRLCPNALMQLVIPAALRDAQDIRRETSPGGRLYQQRAATLAALDSIDGVSCVPNQGAFYVFPKIDARRFGIVDDHRFCMDLLHAKHVMLVPGSGFEWDAPDHFRIVMLPQPHVLRQAILDLGDFLSAYTQREPLLAVGR